MARTQEQRKAETRAGLLAAAADLFAKKGFHAVSAEAVADAANRTSGSLYSHFGNKEGLLLALLEEWKTATADAVIADVPDPGDLDGIISAAWTLLTSAEPTGDDSYHQWLLLEMELWLHSARDVQMGTELAERYGRVRDELAEGLQKFAAATGHRLPAPAEQLASMSFSILLGAALQHRLDARLIPPGWVLEAVHALVGLPAEHDKRSEP